MTNLIFIEKISKHSKTNLIFMEKTLKYFKINMIFIKKILKRFRSSKGITALGFLSTVYLCSSDTVAEDTD